MLVIIIFKFGFTVYTDFICVYLFSFSTSCKCFGFKHFFKSYFVCTFQFIYFDLFMRIIEFVYPYFVLIHIFVNLFSSELHFLNSCFNSHKGQIILGKFFDLITTQLPNFNQIDNFDISLSNFNNTWLFLNGTDNLLLIRCNAIKSLLIIQFHIIRNFTAERWKCKIIHTFYLNL